MDVLMRNRLGEEAVRYGVIVYCPFEMSMQVFSDVVEFTSVCHLKFFSTIYS